MPAAEHDSLNPYADEESILAGAKSLLENSGLDPIELHRRYEHIVREYGRLLEKTKLMARVNDLNHARLQDANEKSRSTIREIREEKEQLHTIAWKDPLTGLENRRGAIQKIYRAIEAYHRDGTNFAVVMGDIDFFKRLNDTYGHAAGDYVLKRIASILRDRLRKDDLISRWGGEEFLILLAAVDINQGREIAGTLRSAVEAERFRLPDEDVMLRVTITFGVSTFRRSEDLDRCLKEADKALYLGKRSGRNRVEGFYR